MAQRSDQPLAEKKATHWELWLVCCSAGTMVLTTVALWAEPTAALKAHTMAAQRATLLVSHLAAQKAVYLAMQQADDLVATKAARWAGW